MPVALDLMPLSFLAWMSGTIVSRGLELVRPRRQCDKEVDTVVARMTLEQIARYLEVEPLEAKSALNRIGICSPIGGDDAILITTTDLKRTAENLAMHRRGWAASANPGRERIV